MLGINKLEFGEESEIYFVAELQGKISALIKSEILQNCQKISRKKENEEMLEFNIQTKVSKGGGS